jgi:hypothetical protein
MAAAARYEIWQMTDPELGRIRDELEHELDEHPLSSESRDQVKRDLQLVIDEQENRKRERAAKPGKGREFLSAPAYHIHDYEP